MTSKKHGKTTKKKFSSLNKKRKTKETGTSAAEIPLDKDDVRPELGKKKKKIKAQKISIGEEGKGSSFHTRHDEGEIVARIKSKKGGKEKSKAPEEEAENMPANKKRRLKKERQKAKPHYDLVVELNKLWNQLREHNISENQKRDLMKELMRLIKGRMHSIAMKHDSSRSVQAAIQFGNKYQRKAILDELSGHITELSQNTYSHFIVLKMFKYCIKEHDSKAILCKAFKGNVTKLATHSVGSKVLELALHTFPSKMAGNLRLELYGKEFALFTDTEDIPKHLNEIIAKWPERKEKVMSNVATIIARMHKKGIFVQSFTHSFIWEYLQEASAAEIEDLTPSLIDATMQFMSTRPGSKIIAFCIGHGSPKNKKKIMKAMKGYLNSILLHRDAYLVLMQIFNAVDDTVNVQKIILNELLNPPDEPQELEESELKSNKKILGLDGKEVQPADKPKADSILQAALGNNSAKVLLLLLAPPQQNPRYYGPDEIALLNSIPTSKKDPSVRQRELLVYLKEHLLALAINSAPEMMRSISASSVLLEIFKTWKTPELLEAIQDAIFLDPDEDGSEVLSSTESKGLNVYEHQIGHLFLKRLLIWEAEMEKSIQGTNEPAPAAFASSLIGMLEKSPAKLKQWVETNRGAFVLETLAKVPSITKRIKDLLKAVYKDMTNLSNTSKGAKALADILQEK
mmetsp:Transcript_31417/g.40262  ORF Transcript_31417/g.40262 Transcript_31417/m.40262 type:complete len:685 (-) Transcript_31417:305-2359(-)